MALEEYADNPDAVQLLTTHRALLRRCRATGLARAFAEQVLPPELLAEAARLGLTPEAFLAQMRAVEQRMPPALREVLAALAAEGVEIHSPEEAGVQRLRSSARPGGVGWDWRLETEY